MLSRIQKLMRKREKIFCAFITLGYPNLGTTEKLLEEFDHAGVDIVELGFPFSDPLADGSTIQYSSQKALKKGVTIEDAFRVTSKIRRMGIQIPIIFFTYFNPVYHFGMERFISRAKTAGLDGILIPDLPPGEDPDMDRACKRAGFPQIHLIAPTTIRERASKIAKRSKGFIYYVSLRGVTGERQFLPEDVRAHLAQLKRLTKKPILVGFGVSTPEQARELCEFSHGVIVGSAIINHLRKDRGKTMRAIEFVRQMVRAVKG